MGVRYLASRGNALRPPAGWAIVVLMLMAALAWPAMMWAAALSTRAMSAKPQPNAKAAHRGGGTSAATALAVVRELRYWSTPSYTRVVIESDGAVQYRVGWLHNPDRLYLDLFGAQLAPKLQGRPIEVIDHIVSSLRAAQNQREVVRIVMDIRSIRDYHVYTINNPYRLVIDVMGAAGSTMVQAPPPASMPRQAGIDPARSRIRPELPTASKGLFSAREYRGHVVIDAGHGGKDPGAIGPSGLVEKDVVLDIAKRLRDLLQQEPRWRVTLTRDSDVFIPLEERTAMANAKGADLFVSIHANAAERPDAHGIETYFLDFASDEQSMRLAARENATTLSKVSDLQHILRDLLMTSKRNESSLLAGSVQQTLVQASGAGKNGGDLGVKHAPFLVLIGAEMPAILVETGFISHPGEERKLADPKYRAQVARAIFEGIRDYLVTTNGSLARQVQR